MAETVLGMVLYFARGLDLAIEAQLRTEWEQSDFSKADSPVREVSGTHLVVLGMGGIGREVKTRAEAFGINVEALDSRATRPQFEQALSRADFLVIAVPETSRTRGLIGAAELALLPAGAVLINVARGSLVDENALLAALRSGHLRGAGLDVFAQEPLPADSPLWHQRGVLVTPHVSAVTRRFWDRQLDLILDNLARYQAGQPLRNVVDKRRGY
jgi:phosphoglycerate dehydrogenase-like enzyme